MSSPVIVVSGLGKRYRLGAKRHQYGSLRESLAGAAAGTWQGVRNLLSGAPPGTGPEEFWALKDVSFEVRQGEVVGIIGRNGAGKSTLLKVLSRITEPTEGRAELRGRVGSLLEVGTGFHPELTGRENIYMSGAILGMRKAEIDRKFDEIVAFADIEKFLDTPCKRYSSGMYVRLGFAVAAHLEPEILVVDEVLAVGDAAFQKKCLGKMSEVSKSGRTVLFVSHNMRVVNKLCSRAVLLAEGRLAGDGNPQQVTDLYLAEADAKQGCFSEISPPEDADSAISSLRLFASEGEYRGQLRAGEPWSAQVVVALRKPLCHAIICCGVMTMDGEPLHSFWTAPCDLPAGAHRITFRYCQIQLSAGSYRIALGLSSHERSLHYVPSAAILNVNDAPFEGVTALRTSGTGFVLNQVDSDMTLDCGERGG